jgi:hypothetical protein
MPTPPAGRAAPSALLRPASRAPLGGLALAGLVACQPKAPTESQRAVIDIGDAFDVAPWRSRPSGPEPIVMKAHIELPAGRRSEAADLVLDGLWFIAEVTVDGRALPAMTGGAPTQRVPLGDAFLDGEADIVLRISPPGPADNPSITGGGLSTFKGEVPPDQAWLARPPSLELHGSQQLRTTVLIAEDDGKVRPVAWTDGLSTAGARVRFSASLDGKTIAELGESVVAPDGRSIGEPVDWSGPRWTPSNPALVQFESTLLDAEGKVLDHRVDRTGVRRTALQPLALMIEDEPYRLHGVRANFAPGPRGFADEIGPMMAAGINAIELHGELVPEDWSSDADELGIPLIRLARCAGLAWQHNLDTTGREALIQDQDRRTVEGLHYHPSTVLWVEEPGPASKGSGRPELESKRLKQDPHRRPNVPDSIGGVPFATNPDRPCGDYPCARMFAREVLGANPANWPDVAKGWSTQLSNGMWGGVLPTAEAVNGLPDAWINTFLPLLTQAGVQPWPRGTRRARANLQVTGLAPGAVVIVEAPGLTPTGAVANARGEALLRPYYEGEATLKSGDGQLPVRLEPVRWNDLSRETKTQVVPWAPVAPTP